MYIVYTIGIHAGMYKIRKSFGVREPEHTYEHAIQIEWNMIASTAPTNILPASGTY